MANFWRVREAVAVSHYWNAVTGGQAWPASAANEIDPTLLDTIARIQDGRQRYDPDPAFVDRLEATLMNANVSAIAATPAPPRRVVTRPAWLPEREMLFPRKWSLAAVATTDSS